jgi:hypothetical protein
MKHKFLPLSICILFMLTAVHGFSQSKKSFAVTGDQLGSVNWTVFRQLDPGGKSALQTIYAAAENNEAVYDATSGKKILNNTSNATAAIPQTCGCLNNRMIAAIAYDAKNNRLYYTTMLGNQLRYLDLNSTEIRSYAVTTQLLKNFSEQPGEASVITRMVIGSDNYGYALTNDNEHLIRFSTGKQPSITDLGKLVDAKTNGENSVKVQFKNWGGDLIADASGNLYLFTIQRNVFKINPNTRLATFLGEIKNIPEDYTINAVMVEKDANVIVGSSTKTNNYYRVNLNTLQAEVIQPGTKPVYNVSDFANANLAFDKPATDAIANTLIANTVTTYPNPVSRSVLNVSFANFTSGKYIIQLSETEGKTLLQKEVKVSGSQTEKLSIASISAGTYLLRVVNPKGESIYNNTIIIGK